jgi:hypothetical protein
MRRFIAILLLGLLWWSEPANAQKIYSMTVSAHAAVRSLLTESAVEKLLKRASQLLQTQDDDQDVSCSVGFKLDRPIETFTYAPAVIRNADDLEAVHSVPADVKVVQRIDYCVGKHHRGGFAGCAWRPEGRRKTVVVTYMGETGVDAVLWAHEFGHTTGLLHRADRDGFALMTPCQLHAFRQHVTEDECRHFLAGPVSYYPPGDGDACPRRHRGD